MDFLILSPPVTTPAEPPSGAFFLTSALCGHGYDAGLLDLSLLFYMNHFNGATSKEAVSRSLTYITESKTGYTPQRHSSELGVIHNDLKRFSKLHQGWTLTAMDLTPPVALHNPGEIKKHLETLNDPFLPLWDKYLYPHLLKHKPKKVLISIAYLSQLTATISLQKYLLSLGIEPIFGGSLPRSLNYTGKGFLVLQKYLKNISISNGASLIPHMDEKTFLSKLVYPKILFDKPYLSARPVIPLSLSIGCFWSKCLFCPDKNMPYNPIAQKALENFIASIPKNLVQKRPIIHLLDSAIPVNQLKNFLEIITNKDIGFYGFARPSKNLIQDNLLEKAAQSGALMLQLGVESGSQNLLSRFNKGLLPKEAQIVIDKAATAGIRTYIYLLFGLPGETKEDQRSTLELLKNCHDKVDFLNLSIFNLPIECELSKRAEEFNIKIEPRTDTDELIELYAPFTVSEKKPSSIARKFIQNELMAVESIKKAKAQTPRWFRAAHLAMMNIPGRNN